jgi:2',3'-cyclic-nucleotide 2'-phosphodiesterase (5'-nucleotidase family)
MKKIAAILITSLLMHSSSFAQNDTLYVIYTANISGALESCDCGKEPLGGVGRIKTFIDQWKTRHPNTVCIDGGDYFNSYPYNELNTAMARALKILDYDIVLPGDQAFIEGKSFYTDLVSHHGSSWLISNMKETRGRTVSLRRGQTKIEVSSYLSEAAFEFVIKPDFVQFLDLNQAFDQDYDTDQIAFRIMIVHGTFEEAQQIVKNLKWIDLILLAHAQERGHDNSSGTSIISAGKGGEYVCLVTVTQSVQQWEISVDFVKIIEGIAVDPLIQPIIDQYTSLVTK